MSYSKSEAAAILAEARRNIARNFDAEFERAEDDDDALTRWSHQMPKPEPKPRERGLDTRPFDWAQWVESRIASEIAIERSAMLQAIGEICGEALGQMLDAERAEYERELTEMRREASKIASAVESLHCLVTTEIISNRAAVVDLPQLPLRGARTTN